ncbi:MAG: histidine kinase [Bacteroidota bacterium]
MDGASPLESPFQTIVRSLPDVVSRLRDDGTVIDMHVPDAFATEFPSGRLVGRRLHEIIPAPLAAKFDAAVAELRRSGEVSSYEYAVEVGGKQRHREVRMAAVSDTEVLSILRDVTPLRDKEDQLEASRAELRALAAHLQSIREEERTRLSREVHDVLGQQITAIRLAIGWFGRHFSEDEAATERLADVRQTIDETLRHVRQIASDLRPGVLDDFGLASAVEWQAKRFETRTGTPAAIDVHGGVDPPGEVATAAFRVLQEALTNIARHADADHVSITLVLGVESVRLVVSDNGRGFDPAGLKRRSLGLVGMRERAVALGGTLDVRGVPGHGTVVECTLPHALPSDT